jgi:Flp pilus assembly pilin Flp
MARSLIYRIAALRIWPDNSGQDMLEYALFIAAICVLYVAFSPSVAAGVSTIFSKISSTLATASTTS